MPSLFPEMVLCCFKLGTKEFVFQLQSASSYKEKEAAAEGYERGMEGEENREGWGREGEPKSKDRAGRERTV